MNNKKITKPIVIAAILVFSVLLTPISATVYDFKDTTNNKAYKGHDNSTPASAPIIFETGLTTPEYPGINTLDTSSHCYSSNDYDFHRFVFKINECIESIQQINVSYWGYGDKDAGCGVDLYIWNYTDPGWEFVGDHYVCGPNPPMITKTYMSGISNYINTTGHLQLLAQTTETGPSCPFLYVWDGTSYHFVTDTNTDGKMGSNSSRQPWPEDYVKIDGSELMAENGVYRLELAEDQDEITYLDSARLIAVDHQPGVELYAARRIRNPEYSNVLPYTLTIRNPRVPVSATDEQGNNVLPLIAAVDRKYTDAQKNYLDTVTIDFGELSGATKIKLLYNAYCDWSDTGSSERRENDRPFVEVINEAGEWERVSEDEHFRNANPKPVTTVLDITDWFKTEDYRIRINNWRDVHIDYVAVDTSEDEAVTVSEVPPTTADLYWKEVSVQAGPDGHQPLVPDFYLTTSLAGSGFRAWSGTFTKYGDVLPLVTETDDKFVIMHAGDSVSLTFNEVPVPEGMERDYYLVSDAYFKSKGNSVDPLPFHSMSEYPYPESERYPNDDEHQAYLAEYNTRAFGSLPGEEGHHTICTNYVSVNITTKPAALEVDKTVWDSVNKQWVKELNASIGDTLRFNCTMHYIGEVNLMDVRFWDILDCSLNYSGNATLTNASGVEEEIPNPSCTLSYCFKPQVLHPYNLSWNPFSPAFGYDVGENFTELCPDTGHHHKLITWHDTNYDERISACDQLHLESYDEWYHVENVPYTLLVNATEMGESMYIESVLDYGSFDLSNPNGTEWLMMCGCKDRYTLIDWKDIANNFAQLSVGDQIALHNERTEEEVQYTVEEVTIDLVVSKEWQIDWLPDNYTQRLLEPCQSITFEYDATVVRCGVDNNTFFAKGFTQHVWHYSDPDVVTITVPCPQPCIAGYKRNESGVGLANWTIIVTNSSGAVVGNTTTDGTGYWQVCGLAPGNYTVCEEPQPGWETVAPASGCHEITFGPAFSMNLNFINRKCNGSISDYVWLDADQDGIQDGDESGIAGVTVNLYRHESDGTLFDTKETDGNGYYIFENLCAGNYSLEFVPPAGFVLSPPNQGDPAEDSDADPTTWRTKVFHLESGDANTTIDAGVYYPIQEVPAFTSGGLIALVSLLSAIVVLAIRKRR